MKKKTIQRNISIQDSRLVSFNCMINCCIRLKMTRIISRMMVFIVKSVSIFFFGDQTAAAYILWIQNILFCFTIELNGDDLV